MKLILIRHGDPNYKDNCLTPLGHAQAEALAKRIERKGTEVTAICASDYGRAIETAEHTAIRLGKDITRLEFMHEISYGLHGASKEEKLQYSPWKAPAELVRNGVQIHSYDPDNFWGYKGTKLEEAVERVCGGFDAWIEQFGLHREGYCYRCDRENSDNILVFAHGGTISVLFGYLTSSNVLAACTYLRLHCTGVTEFEFRCEPGALLIPLVRRFNDHAHLEGLTCPDPEEGSFED